MQTITTKYLGPTNHRGSRIKATTSSGISNTISWDYAKGTIQNHERAIHELNLKLSWDGELVGGSPDDKGDSYIWTFVRGRDGTYNTLRLDLLPF